MKGILKLWLRIILLFAISSFIIACQKESQPNIPAEKKREFANVLFNQQLYEQAVKEYEEYLRNYPLEEREQANISYQIANIYFERLHNYENALAYYLRLKYLYSNPELEKEANKKIVACLERLQRSADARQVMQQSTALDESQKPQSRPGEVIARIGEREITLGDLNYEINRLPPYLQSQLSEKENKIEFLKQYIAQELLYDSAKRQELDKDPEVQAGIIQAQKALMAQKLLQMEIEKENIDEKYSNADVETYYQANKEKYARRDDNGKIKDIPPFNEVARQVANDFMQEKQQEAYQKLIERLMAVEEVKIFEDKLK